MFFTKIRNESDRWYAYRDALNALRESVDATRKEYSGIADNAKVSAELTSKNQGSPKIKFALGPSQQFTDIERKLMQHEKFVKSRDDRGKDDKGLTPARGLPPDF